LHDQHSTIHDIPSGILCVAGVLFSAGLLATLSGFVVPRTARSRRQPASELSGKSSLSEALHD
jgi:hypothetical protein